jgi:hypothetical protein
MKKTILNHLTIFSFCTVLLTMASAASAIAQSGTSGNVKTGIVKVKTFAGTGIIPQAGASLSRNNEGVFAAIYTSSLTPNTVVTLWWVFFNNPKACAGTPCTPPDLNNPDVNGSLQYGGGKIVGTEGTADFGGYLEVGDNTGFYFLPQFPNMPNPAPGLVNPKTAEVHLVIRTHGPASADPVILQQQLTTFPGGCSVVPNPCANIQAAQFLP